MSGNEDERNQKLKAWFSKKGVSDKCPACGHAGWSAGPVVSLSIVLEGGVPDRTLPMSPVICKNCGRTAFFSDVIAG